MKIKWVVMAGSHKCPQHNTSYWILYETFLTVPVALCPSPPSQWECRGWAHWRPSSPSPPAGWRARCLAWDVLMPAVLSSSIALTIYSPPETVALLAWERGAHMFIPTVTGCNCFSGCTTSRHNQFWECCARSNEGKASYLVWCSPINIRQIMSSNMILLLSCPVSW